MTDDGERRHRMASRSARSNSSLSTFAHRRSWRRTSWRPRPSNPQGWHHERTVAHIEYEVVPQVVAEIVEVVKLVPREPVQERTVVQSVDEIVPQVLAVNCRSSHNGPQERISGRILRTDRSTDRSERSRGSSQTGSLASFCELIQFLVEVKNESCRARCSTSLMS